MTYTSSSTPRSAASAPAIDDRLVEVVRDDGAPGEIEVAGRQHDAGSVGERAADPVGDALVGRAADDHGVTGREPLEARQIGRIVPRHPSVVADDAVLGDGGDEDEVDVGAVGRISVAAGGRVAGHHSATANEMPSAES